MRCPSPLIDGKHRWVLCPSAVPMPEITLANVEKDTHPMPLILTKAQAMAFQYATYHALTAGGRARLKFFCFEPSQYTMIFQGRDLRVVVSNVEDWRTIETERYENVEAFETAYKLETLI